MSKINKPLLYKITGIAGIVSLPVVTTLGVVYGTKEDEYNSQREPAVTFGERFFDQNMSDGASSYASRTLFTPYRPAEGGGDISELIRLDKYFDTPGAHRILARDSNGVEKGSLKTVTIKTSNIISLAQLEKAFKDANVELYRAVQANSRKNLGIYLEKDLRTREILASIYELQTTSADDQQLLNQYLTDLGDFGVPGINSDGSINPDMFYQVFGSQNTLSPDQIHYYNFTTGGNSVTTQTSREHALWNKYGLISVDNQVQFANKYINDPTLREDEKKFKFVDGQDKVAVKEGHQLVGTFFEKNLVPTYTPSIDWAKRELKVTITMHKLDQKSTYNMSLGDHIKNAVATYSIVKHIPLSHLVSPKPSGAMVPADKTNAIAQLKQFLSLQIPRYINNRIVGTGFPIISSLVESTASSLDSIIRIGKALSYDTGTPPTGLGTDDVNNPLSPKYEFNPSSPQQTWHNLIFQKDVLDDDAFVGQMVDKLYADPAVDLPAVVKLMTEFEGRAFGTGDHYWTDIDKLQAMYARGGGQYNLYQITSIFNSIGDMLYEKMQEENPMVKTMMEAQQGDDHSKSLIDRLMKFLHSKNVITKEYNIENLLSNPIAEVIKILRTISEKQIPLPEDVIHEALPIVPIQLIADNADGVANAIIYLTQGNNLSQIFSLLGADVATQDKNIEDLMDAGTRWEAIERLVSNKNVTQNQILTLFTALKLTGIIPASLNFILGDTPTSAEAYAKLFANGGAKEIFDLIKEAFEHGIFSMMGDTWVEGVDKDDAHAIDATDITKITDWMNNLDKIYLYSFKNGINKLVGGDVASEIGLTNTDNEAAVRTKLNTYIDSMDMVTYTKVMNALSGGSAVDKATFKNSLTSLTPQQFGSTLTSFMAGVTTVKASRVIQEADDVMKNAIETYINAVPEADYDTFATKMNAYINASTDPVFTSNDLIPTKAELDAEVAASATAASAPGSMSTAESFDEIRATRIGNWISGRDFKTLQSFGKFVNTETPGTVLGTDAATPDDFLKEQLVKSIKDTIVTSADLKALFNKMPVVNDFTIRMTSIVDKILSVIKVAGMDLNSFKPLVAQYLPTILSTIDRTITKPLTSETEIFGIVQQMKPSGDLYHLYGIVLNLVKTLPLPDADLLSGFIGTLSGFATQGIDGFVTSKATETGSTHQEAATNIVADVLKLFFPSGFVKGKADSPVADQLTVDQTTAFASGLLNGFSSSSALVTAMTPILGASTMATEIPSIGGTVSDVFTNIYNHKKLFGGPLGVMANGYIKGDMIAPIQKMFKTGMLSLTKTDFVKLFSGFKQTLAQSIFVNTGISIHILFITTIDVDLPIIGTLKELAANMDANVVGDAFFNLLHTPLTSLPSSEVDAVIDLIDSTKLLTTRIPHLGVLIHDILNNGLSSTNSVEINDVLKLAGLSSGVREIVLKAFFGTNYKDTFVSSVKTKADAIVLPTKVALVAGAELPISAMKYDAAKALFDQSKAKFDLSTTDGTTMAQIMINYEHLLADVERVEKANSELTLANAAHATALSDITSATPPAEVVFTASDATLLSQLNGRTYAAINAKLAAKKAEATASKTTTQLKAIKSEVDAILEEFVQYNKDITKLNSGQSLTISRAGIMALLKAHHPSGSYTPTVAVWNELKAAGVKVYADSTFTYISLDSLESHHTELSGEAVAGKVEISIDLLIAAAGRSYSQPKINVDTLLFVKW